MTARNIATLVLTIVLIVAFGAVPKAEAVDDVRTVREIVAALEKLDDPPALDAVLSIARRARCGGETTALRVVAGLRTCRGHAVARALGVLAEHSSPAVQEAALTAIAENGVRVTETVQEVRSHLADGNASVRIAALTALGAVGDASDVPALLAATRSGDPNVIHAGYEALRALSGARLPYRDTVWSRWWKETSDGVPQRLACALTLLEKGGSAVDLSEARALVCRLGWIDLRSVDERILAWLESSDARLRADAYAIAGKLRLGDLAQAVEWNLSFESAPAAREVGLAAAKVLGLRTDHAGHPADR